MKISITSYHIADKETQFPNLSILVVGSEQVKENIFFQDDANDGKWDNVENIDIHSKTVEKAIDAMETFHNNQIKKAACLQNSHITNEVIFHH